MNIANSEICLAIVRFYDIMELINNPFETIKTTENYFEKNSNAFYNSVHIILNVSNVDGINSGKGYCLKNNKFDIDTQNIVVSLYY